MGKKAAHGEEGQAGQELDRRAGAEAGEHPLSVERGGQGQEEEGKPWYYGIFLVFLIWRFLLGDRIRLSTVPACVVTEALLRRLKRFMHISSWQPRVALEAFKIRQGFVGEKRTFPNSNSLIPSRDSAGGFYDIASISWLANIYRFCDVLRQAIVSAIPLLHPTAEPTSSQGQWSTRVSNLGGEPVDTTSWRVPRHLRTASLARRVPPSRRGAPSHSSLQSLAGLAQPCWKPRISAAPSCMSWQAMPLRPCAIVSSMQPAQARALQVAWRQRVVSHLLALVVADI